jgi:hypothetical protein
MARLIEQIKRGTKLKLVSYADCYDYYDRSGLKIGDIAYYDCPKDVGPTGAFSYIMDKEGRRLKSLGRDDHDLYVRIGIEWAVIGNECGCKSRCPSCAGKCSLWESE